MAEAYGKLTGRPGIALVTRGPGATNAAIGVHAAAQDSTPMILFVGQVGGDFVDREAFQEIDYRRMFGSVAKWAAQIDRAERIPEYVAHAYRIAMSGRPGPVVLALPEDMLSARADVRRRAARRCRWRRRRIPRWSRPRRSGLPSRSGRSCSSAAAAGTRRRAGALREVAEALQLPVACGVPQPGSLRQPPSALRRRRRHRHQSEACRAHARRRRAARDRRAAGRDDDVGLHAARRRPCRADADPRASGRRRARPRLSARARDRRDARRVSRGTRARSRCHAARVRAAADAHADYVAWQAPRPVPGDARSLADRALARRSACPTTRSSPTAPATTRRGCTAFIATAASARSSRPTSGSMGYGVPAAIAAKVVHPERIVLSWNGDGCFLMNGQELATAVQYGLAIVFVVVDNGMYGTIRMHQERTYPAREYGTALVNPDFAALARAYGAHGETVARTDGVRACVRARAGRGPAGAAAPQARPAGADDERDARRAARAGRRPRRLSALDYFLRASAARAAASSRRCAASTTG